jgi:enoyl-CoA hydratase/carnithine racemase
VTAHPAAVLTIADITALTSHDGQACREVRDQLLSFADDDSVKAIILRGLVAKGGGAPAAQGDGAAWQAYIGVRGLHQIAAYCKKVLIAEVDGACAGAGSALCLAADFVVATPGSTFAAPFAEIPEASYVLALLTMRANRAKAWTLRPRPFDAREALEAGLINQIADPAQLEDATSALAAAVSLMPLDGITVTKMNINAAFDAAGVGREFDAVEAQVSSHAISAAAHG